MNDLSLFQRQPWFGAPLQLARTPVGMLERYEAALFYHLAKEWFTGRGTIIDAGSFLGKSAFFFAEGLRQNADPAAVGQRIHCFDIFRANEFMTVEFVREHAHQEVPLGGSTRGIFFSELGASPWS